MGINFYDDDEYICGGSLSCNPPPNPIYGNGTFVCGKMLGNPDNGKTNFDTIFYSLLIVYQSVTLEGWSIIMYWLANSVSVGTVVFSLVLTFIGNNVLVNLTLAVIKAKFTSQEKKNREMLL